MIADEPRPSRTSLAAPAIDARLTVWSSAAGRAQAGGDWCDAVELTRDVTALTVGDVSGHGIAVAKTMVVIRAAVLGALRETRVPSSVLAAANEAALFENDGVIVTAIVAFLDRRSRTLTFANAGHPPPLLLTGSGHAFLQHSPGDLPLGVFANFHAAEYVLSVPPDALVVFYTDGLTEHDRDLVRGEAELVLAAREVHARPELNAARAIARRVLQHERGTDDAAALAVRMTPQADPAMLLRVRPPGRSRSRRSSVG